MQKIIAIMGPTATGKTDLAIALTKDIPADIVSVDSAMVYREMNIGTAKPDHATLSSAPHQLIDFLDPTQPYSAGQFCKDAMQAVHSITEKKRVPMLVGGTMLYFHKLFFGLAELPEADATLRKKILEDAQKNGWAQMHAELKKHDPQAAEKIKPQDPQRIQRALEVFYLTGKRISEIQKNNYDALLNNHDVFKIALIPEDRAWLHARIAERFQMMLAHGLIDEVKKLRARGDLSPDMPAMRVVGYRQAWQYLEGEITQNEMVEKAIAATRQLAKRQMTWLRRWPDLHVFDPRDPALVEHCLKKWSMT